MDSGHRRSIRSDVRSLTTHLGPSLAATVPNHDPLDADRTLALVKHLVRDGSPHAVQAIQ